MEDKQAQSNEEEPEEVDTTDDAVIPAPNKRRHRWRRVLIAFTIITILSAASLVGVRYVYQGPRTLDEVVAVMPGVPIFPLSKISSRNQASQRAMAMPLWILRKQGLRRVDTTMLESPAESDFIVEWYLQTAPTQNWQLMKKDSVQGNTRMLFLRGAEGLQVLIGPSDGLLAPVQLIYFDGLTARHLRDFRQER